MKVLVTGASGFLGRHVVDRLLQAGHEVRAIVRSVNGLEPLPEQVDVIQADLRQPQHYAGAFAGIEGVVHLAAAVSGDEDQQFASSVVGTESFLKVMIEARVQRMVHVSSFVVYDWKKARGELTEDSPLAASIYEMGAYSIAKFWQERIVTEAALKHGLRLTVLRPGFIWGRAHTTIAAMGRQAGRFHLMFGPFTRIPLTYVENCADCIVAALDRQPPMPEVFNVVDSDDVRVWRYCRANFRAGGARRIPVPIPYWVGKAVANLASLTSRMLFGRGGRLPSLLSPLKYEAQFKPLRYPTRKLRQELNWSPAIGFVEAMERSHQTATSGRQ